MQPADPDLDFDVVSRLQPRKQETVINLAQRCEWSHIVIGSERGPALGVILGEKGGRECYM